MSETTLTPFDWPSGPSSVQVSGDWDGWKDKVDLDKEADGSFNKKIPLPSNTKHQYKYIVDGQWTTKSSSPIIDADGNQNNVIEVGSSSTGTESSDSKAAEIGVVGTAAGVTGAGAGAAVVASAAGAGNSKSSADHGSVGEEKKIEENLGAKKDLSNEEKKANPAAELMNAADEDIRNQVPTSVTNATHGVMPVLASAIATVTGADLLRGNAESLPVSQKEINDTQAQALRGDNAALASRLEPQGGAVSDPAAATTENAKAASTVANNATTGAPIVPVTNNGFAANITGDSGNLTTAADQKKEGGEKAGAVAAASAGALGVATAGGIAATAAKANGDGSKLSSNESAPVPVKETPTAVKSAEQTKPLASATSIEPLEAKMPPKSNTAAETTQAKTTPSEKPAASSAPIAAAGGVAKSNAKSHPSTGPKDSKIQADKATAPAAASSAPLARGKETTTPAAAPVSKSAAPATAPKSSAATSSSKDKVAPSTPSKKSVPKASDAIQDSKAKSATNASTSSATKNSNSKPANVSPSTAKLAAGSPASSAPATPERKKKTGLFGKIKQALSPHGSPDK